MNVVQMIQTEPEEQATFDDFWLLYPRREAKKDAKKSWSRMAPNQQMEALIALMDWRRVFQARESAQYTPLAATWLNGERWEDELPVEFRKSNTATKDAQAFKATMGEAKTNRVPMPDKLRELLATLKK